MGMRYWEDLTEGERFTCRPIPFDREGIVAFGKEYDPLPFHVGGEASDLSIFGDVIASALHTLSCCTRVVVEAHGDIAILSGLWLTEIHGGFNSAALSTDFDRTLILKSVLVVLLCIGALIHDYVLGPRLQRELRAGEPQAPVTRRRLIMVGWFNFSLTIAVPILGAIVLGYLD